MWMKLGKAVLTALLLVVVAELSARAVVARIGFANSYDEPRNPNFRRAWPAFTEPRPRGPEDRLIILISNSQGYAPELRDGEQCYAHQLELLLNAEDPAHPTIVANWSVGGGSSPEMLLLTARAIEHKPDLLMLVTHTEPFTFNRVKMEPSFYISDCNLLMYDAAVRSRLLARDRDTLFKHDIGLFLESHSGLLRLRGAFVEHREKRWVPRQQSRNHPQSVRRDHLAAAPKVQRRGRLMVRSIVRTFHGGLPDTPMMLVSMPLCESRWRPRSWPALQGFAGLIGDVLAETPGDTQHVRVVNAVDVIDDARFITSTHLGAEGHADFARFLLPRVRAALDGHATDAGGRP